MNHENQLEDKPELLELMLNDTKNSPKLYQPTKYWYNYEKKFLPELKRLGLKDFRRRKNSIFQSFGAADIDPIDLKLRVLNKDLFEGIFPLKKSILFKRFIRSAIRIKLFRRMVEQISRLWLGISLEQKLFFTYQFAKHYGIANKAQLISNLSDSLISSPKNILKINDNVYTFTLLRYYLHYAYTCKFIDYSSIFSVLEIGPGYGGQVEVLKKLHPNMTIFVIDIPPQLYVCEQYLKAVFPNDVISYEKTRNMVEIPVNSKGKIFIFSPWQLPKIKNLVYDLFWNSASFQEMNSEVVLNYLKFVNAQTQKFVFLNEEMELITSGNTYLNWIGATKEDYFQGLKNFELIDYSPSLSQFLGPNQNYTCAIWQRKQSSVNL